MLGYVKQCTVIRGIVRRKLFIEDTLLLPIRIAAPNGLDCSRDSRAANYHRNLVAALSRPEPVIQLYKANQHALLHDLKQKDLCKSHMGPR